MSQNKVALKNFTEEELKEFVKSIGEPAFRGSQIYSWIYKGAKTFDDMKNIPKSLDVYKRQDTLEEDMKLKEVVDVLDEEPIFKLDDLELVNWMKNRYLCTYIDCINLIYPKGYKVNNYKVVSLSDEVLNLNENEFTDLLSSLDLSLIHI